MIEIEHRDEVAILHLVRGRGNALDLAFIGALADALRQIEQSDARAAVITGRGSVFGAGVDLPALVAGGPDYVRQFVPAMIEAFEQLVHFPKPLVAAVNGHAIAGGAIIMLACDMRILAEGTARIGLTEALVGVRFPAWALEIARFATPPQHFSEMILTGRTWLPADALRRGLVDELVPADQLLERAFTVAREMGAIPAETFTATKLAVRKPMIEAARRETALADAETIDRWCSPEVLENISAFVARTIGGRGAK